MIEPHSSSLLHVPSSAVSKEVPQQSVSYLAVMRGVFSATEGGAEKDSLADLAVRLQLALLQEGLTEINLGSTCVDVPRQVRNARCGCRRLDDPSELRARWGCSCAVDIRVYGRREQFCMGVYEHEGAVLASVRQGWSGAHGNGGSNNSCVRVGARVRLS